MNSTTESQQQDIVVITGGAGGMGLITAKILGADHRVILCDVNPQRLESACAELREQGIHCEAKTCDITELQSVTELAAYAAQQGTLKAVVHTAGLSPQMANPETIMRVNALGTININNAFLQVAGEGFAMVNVASMAGHMLPVLLLPSRSYPLAFSDTDRFFRKMMARCNLLPKKARTGMAYSISKNFVMWYSKALAGRYGEKGARILSVSPGTIDTAMGRLEEKSGSAKLLDFAALKRFGRPEEVAELLAFCASDKASYMTGIDIPCDGGVIACITPKDLRSLST